MRDRRQQLGGSITLALLMAMMLLPFIAMLITALHEP